MPTLLPFELRIASGLAVATYPAGATFGPRALRDWEFVWMIEGDALYRRGGESVSAPAGSVVLCRPGATDFFRWDARRRTRHAYFHFEIVGALPSEWPAPDAWPLVRPADADGDLLRPLFRHLVAAAAPEHADPTLTRLLAHALLAAFATGQTTSGSVESERPPAPVERAMAHIAERLDESPADAVPLSELAEAACVTPEYLCRLFRSATGRTPAETVRLARLDRSAQLLSRTNYSVGEVARLCGFESPFHFSRLFRRTFGQSPREYRQALSRGERYPASRTLRTITVKKENARDRDADPGA